MIVLLELYAWSKYFAPQDSDVKSCLEILSKADFNFQKVSSTQRERIQKIFNETTALSFTQEVDTKLPWKYLNSTIARLFHNVRSLQIEKATVDESTFRMVSSIPQLEEVRFIDCTIPSFEPIEHLTKITKLKSLIISNCTGVNNQALAYMEPFTNITRLDLLDAKEITNTGLHCFRSMKNLKNLKITESRITMRKQGIQKMLPQLTTLEISNSHQRVYGAFR